jgi:hypothetical protein
VGVLRPLPTPGELLHGRQHYVKWPPVVPINGVAQINAARNRLMQICVVRVD